MATRIRHFSELQKLMTPEQKKKAKEDYDKFYGIPFGHLEPIYPKIESEIDDTYYDKHIDMENWD